jgi:hypothetical protein
MMTYPFDAPAMYAIRIAGEVDRCYLALLVDNCDCKTERSESGESVTILTGLLADQAALMGLLNMLYNLHYPLLSLKYLRPG